MIKISTNKEKFQELLTRGVEHIYPSVEALEKTLQSGKKLRVYLGIDPTGPTLHIGHGVELLKLRQFQELGHNIILLIGDFTAMIGDPSYKSAARRCLTRQEVMDNCKEYIKQAGKILDISKVEVKYNSQWLAKLNFTDILKIASEITVPRLLERDMFQKRIKDGKDVHAHEFLYPLMQGYDSVAMDVDVEVGGNDQTFNMLIGRKMMGHRGKEKFVIAMKLLTDSTGAKMGKTEGNMVALSDTPEEMYGKVMSWTDAIMPLAFEICARVKIDEIIKLLKGNPRDTKMRLAQEIVALYYGAEAGRKAEREFVRTFQRHEAPDKIHKLRIMPARIATQNVAGGNHKLGIVELLVKAKLAVSKSEARRVVEQGGVKIDGEVINNPEAIITLSSKGALVQKGKRYFVRIYGS